MNCTFCGNPSELVDYLFESENQINSTKPINDALICDKCVRKRYNFLMKLIAQKSKEFVGELAK